jgi:hypothetical protein
VFFLWGVLNPEIPSSIPISPFLTAAKPRQIVADSSPGRGLGEGEPNYMPVPRIPRNSVPRDCSSLGTLFYGQPTYFFMNTLFIKSFCPQKKHSRTLIFLSRLIRHGRHFDYWTQPLNMRMHVWNLDYHEAGLCCYLVIHIENLLRPSQMFYLHLWPIYSLSLVHKSAASSQCKFKLFCLQLSYKGKGKVVPVLN